MRFPFQAIFVLAVQTLFGQTYSLDPLVSEAHKHVAPPEVQRAMHRFLRNDLANCSKELELSTDAQATYFSSIPLDLSRSHSTYTLVFPSIYCSAFFGTHAIAYWILEQCASGRFRVLYQGRGDGIEILPTKSRGMNDLRPSYGRTFIIIKFKGKAYRRVSSGEFSLNE